MKNPAIHVLDSAVRSQAKFHDDEVRSDFLSLLKALDEDLEDQGYEASGKVDSAMKDLNDHLVEAEETEEEEGEEEEVE